MRWLLVFVLWLGTAQALLHTDQGLYEDHVYMSTYSSNRPALWQARGLFYTSIWTQSRQHATPSGIRRWNLTLSALVSLSVGLLAYTLGWSSWVATGVMALHPLTVETVALVSGRAELLAALGIVWACIVAVSGLSWRLKAVGIVAGLALAALGKETAIVGVALVPLCLCLKSDTRQTRRLVGCGVLIVTLAALWYRNIGLTPAIPLVDGWWMLQSGAAFRLLTLTLWPVGQTLDFDYDALTRGYHLLAFACLAAMSVSAVQSWSRWKPLAFALLWMLIAILPRLIVQTPKSYFNEHQFYLALVGFALGASALHRPYAHA